MSILQLNQLEVGYQSTILGPITLEVPAASFVLIEGPNGIGKSTLLKTLIGLARPRAGTCAWQVDASRLRFVPQTRTLDVLLPATVKDVMETGFQRGGGWASFRSRPDPDQIRRALESVGMSGLKKHLFRELSEGQKQLILLARALLADPAVILLDEPAASMDPEREKLAVDILKREQAERGCTIFMIAHGSEASREAADHLLTISRDRQTTFGPKPGRVHAENMAQKEEKCGTP